MNLNRSNQKELLLNRQGMRLAAHLNQTLDDLPRDVTERLRAARAHWPAEKFNRAAQRRSTDAAANSHSDGVKKSAWVGLDA